MVEDYGGVGDGEKGVRWYKRKLETLFYVLIKFLPRFMDSAYHVPMWIPSCPRKTATAIVKASPSTVGVCVGGWGPSVQIQVAVCALKTADNGPLGDIPGGVKPLPIGRLAESLSLVAGSARLCESTSPFDTGQGTRCAHPSTLPLRLG